MSDKHERAVQLVVDILMRKLDEKTSLILDADEADWENIRYLNDEIDALLITKKILIEEGHYDNF